jgi:hypothetical protein
MKRETSFTLDQLRGRLVAGGQSGCCKGYQGPCTKKDLPLKQLPTGFVLNEIGAIFCEGNKEAEKDLLDLLKESNGNAELAYFFLSYGRENLSAEAAKIVEDYETSPDNEDSVAFVKQRLNEFIERERATN